MVSICCESNIRAKVQELTEKNPLPLVDYFLFKSNTPAPNFKSVKKLPFLILVDLDGKVVFEGNPKEINLAETIEKLKNKEKINNPIDSKIAKNLKKFFSDPEFIKLINLNDSKYFSLNFKFEKVIGYNAKTEKNYSDFIRPYLRLKYHYSLKEYANIILKKIFDIFPKEIFRFEELCIEKHASENYCVPLLKQALPAVFNELKDMQFIAVKQLGLWSGGSSASNVLYQSSKLGSEHFKICSQFNKSFLSRFKEFNRNVLLTFIKEFFLNATEPEDYDEINCFSESWIQQNLEKGFDEVKIEDYKKLLKLYKSEEFQAMIKASKQSLEIEVQKLKIYDNNFNYVKTRAVKPKFRLFLNYDAEESAFDELKKKIVSVSQDGWSLQVIKKEKE